MDINGGMHLKETSYEDVDYILRVHNIEARDDILC
jgi:hypothetical protein